MDNSQLSKLEELLNLMKSNSESYILEKFTDVLKSTVENKNYVFENANSLPVINESIQILTKRVFEEQSIPITLKNLYLELLLLLFLSKLNFLNVGDIKYYNTSISVINTGIKLIKYFNDCQQNLKAEYYSRKCKATLNMLANEKNIQEQFPVKITLREMEMTLNVYHVEALIDSEKLNEAFDEIQNMKYSIEEFADHKDYFFHLSYNAGVKLVEKEQYENAIVILETAHNMKKSVDTSIQVEIACLLAHVYLLLNPEQNWNKCLTALDSIPHRNLHPSSLSEMMRAALLSKTPSVIENTLQKIAKSSDLSFEMVLKISKDLEANSCGNSSSEFLRNARMSHEFRTSEKLHLMSLELRAYFKENCLEKASVLVEEAAGLLRLEEDPNAVRRLCGEMSAYSHSKFEARLFSESLSWYTKCSRLVESSKDASALKYIRQRICLCHIRLDDVASAKRILDDVDVSSESSTDPFDLYLLLQVAVMSEDEALADMVLNHIGKDARHVTHVLLTCCKSALDSGKKGFLCKILEAMLDTCSPTADVLLHAKISQCLVRLFLKDAENEASVQKILTFLNKGLDSFQKNERDTADLSEWFFRISWNLALKPGLEPSILFQLSMVCCRCLEVARGPVLRLRNALMMTVTSGLECLRKRPGEKQDIAKKILLAIEKLKHLEIDGSTVGSLLHAYEFETRLLVNDSAAEFSLKQMMKSACVDTKILKNVAAIAYERSPTNLRIISVALRGAIQKEVERPVVDCEEVSALYHSLLQILFHNQEYSSALVEEECFEVCQGVLKLPEDILKEYPQMEVLWLMSKCWNWGVRRWASSSTDSVRVPRDWCTLALGFADKLTEPLLATHATKLNALHAAHFAQDEGPQH